MLNKKKSPPREQYLLTIGLTVQYTHVKRIIILISSGISVVFLVKWWQQVRQSAYSRAKITWNRSNKIRMIIIFFIICSVDHDKKNPSLENSITESIGTSRKDPVFPKTG